MLHIKSWKSSSQGIHPISFGLLGICLVLVSCFGGRNQELSEAERSAFGEYVNQMDSSLTGTWFDRMGVSADADSVFAYLRSGAFSSCACLV